MLLCIDLVANDSTLSFPDLDYSSSSSPGLSLGGQVQVSNVGLIPGQRVAEDLDYSHGNISLLKAQLKVSSIFCNVRVDGVGLPQHKGRILGFHQGASGLSLGIVLSGLFTDAEI